MKYCNVLRRKVIRQGTFNMSTGEHKINKVFTSVEECETPLFSHDGEICRSCSEGWGVAGNYMIGREVIKSHSLHKGYRVVTVGGKFFCFMAYEETLKEWQAYETWYSEFIAGGLTIDECLDSIARGFASGEFELKHYDAEKLWFFYLKEDEYFKELPVGVGKFTEPARSGLYKKMQNDVDVENLYHGYGYRCFTNVKEIWNR